MRERNTCTFACGVLAVVTNNTDEISLSEYAKRREKIRQKLGDRCFYCRTKENITIHHIINHSSNRAISRSASIMEDEQALERGELALLCVEHHTLYHELEREFFPNIRRHHYADFFKSFIDCDIW